jgi:hypothetical protein
MNWLVRLYPPSWRKRYGAELEGLVDDMPGRTRVALDLVVGAAIAYRDVIRANRVLSAAAAYLHGLCVAVLVQAIVFVSLVLLGQGSTDPSDFRVGPVDFTTVVGIPRFDDGGLQQALSADIWVQKVALPVTGEIALLAVLLAALVFVLSIPRLARSLR